MSCLQRSRGQCPCRSGKLGEPKYTLLRWHCYHNLTSVLQHLASVSSCICFFLYGQLPLSRCRLLPDAAGSISTYRVSWPHQAAAPRPHCCTLHSIYPSYTVLVCVSICCPGFVSSVCSRVLRGTAARRATCATSWSTTRHS
mgnify:CR=1 FL=1